MLLSTQLRRPKPRSHRPWSGFNCGESCGDTDKLLDDYLLGDEDDLGDEEGPSIEEIMEMDINGLGSDDDIEGGCFSRTEAERTFEDRPVLETATHLSADMRQEILVAK